MKETFLYYLWEYYFSGKIITINERQQVKIIHPGTRNDDSGPDFFNAKIFLNETLWAGNIEIHVNGSDWYRHGHQEDVNYNNVILHVVYNCDKFVYRKNNEEIPCLELKGRFNESLYRTYQKYILSPDWIPCANDMQRIGFFKIYQWLERMAFERIERKTNDILAQTKNTKGDLLNIFYRKFFRSFGMRTNGDAFEHLAITLPLPVITKHSDNLIQLEALLFGQAGFLNDEKNDPYYVKLKKEYFFLSQKYGLTALPKHTWKFMRMRPSNFPTIRIAQLAFLFYKSPDMLTQILNADTPGKVIYFLESGVSEFWFTHYTFDKIHSRKAKKIGKETIYSIIINSIIPFLFAYGQMINDEKVQNKGMKWLEDIPPENHTVSRHFAEIGVRPLNAVQTQGMLELKLFYCDASRCLECAIGHQLISSSQDINIL